MAHCKPCLDCYPQSELSSAVSAPLVGLLFKQNHHYSAEVLHVQRDARLEVKRSQHVSLLCEGDNWLLNSLFDELRLAVSLVRRRGYPTGSQLYLELNMNLCFTSLHSGMLLLFDMDVTAS